MKLYLVLGIVDFDYGDLRFFYGCFSSEEKAEKVKKDLEESPNRNKYERFEIEEHILDEPTAIYDLMMTS